MAIYFKDTVIYPSSGEKRITENTSNFTTYSNDVATLSGNFEHFLLELTLIRSYVFPSNKIYNFFRIYHVIYV